MLWAELIQFIEGCRVLRAKGDDPATRRGGFAACCCRSAFGGVPEILFLHETCVTFEGCSMPCLGKLLSLPVSSLLFG